MFFGDIMIDSINKILWGIVTIFIIIFGFYFSKKLKFKQFKIHSMITSFSSSLENKGISTFLMLIDADNEENVKTRFYYDGDKLVYIKNMIDQDGEKLEELIQAECSYEVNEKLFEIPEDYAEV